MALLPRALILATKGILGSVLARATRGRLQIDQNAVAVRYSTHAHTTARVTLSPVVQPVIPVVTAATGGGTNIYSTRWFDEEPPVAYRFTGFGVLVLESKSSWRLREAILPPLLFDWYDATVDLYLGGTATSTHWDQGADDEDVEILLMAYLQLEDAPYVWPDEKYS